MTQKNAILWFRKDLRLSDNPALYQAITQGYAILPIYIHDGNAPGEWPPGGASKWWLHHSLTALNHSLNENLCTFSGDAQEIMTRLVKQINADAVFWNRATTPWQEAQDKSVEKLMDKMGIECQTYNASLLREPPDLLKDDGTPYRVFTPFFRAGYLNRDEPNMHQNAPDHIPFAPRPEACQPLSALGLLPKIPWYKEMKTQWQPGEDGAQKRLKAFLKTGLKGYAELRNRPDMENISRLSPHLHFGEISPRTVWYEATGYALANNLESDLETFRSELGWREFSHTLLHHNPDLPKEPLQTKFKAFPWENNPHHLQSWQRGKTGIPIVDAGMRQLWREGWMHNRVRMIVASFLVKNLRLHWHHGQDWFWDCLVDADLANNAASWQWVAGCGADAAPYFRIFNPVTQGEKFDPKGTYVRKYVHELREMPADYIHKPWDAPQGICAMANLHLGENYPRPLVDLKASRDKALECYQQIK
ncbi:MAG: deoxyribodipyrimidine photo-lyase [Alphaproteobacteria bacterium]|nr:deoxyribodipyrimidine photo-lyase [Alphaproteobacteria bacterium]